MQCRGLENYGYEFERYLIGEKKDHFFCLAVAVNILCTDSLICKWDQAKVFVTPGW